MKGNKHRSLKGGRSLVSSVVIGVLTSLLLSVLLSAVVANLLLNGSFHEKHASGIVNAVRGISVLIGALIGGVLLKEKYLPQAALTIFGYILVLFGCGTVFYDGGVRHLVSGCISAFVGGTVALVILQLPKKKKHNALKFD